MSDRALTARSADIHPTIKEIPMCYPVACPVCGKTTWEGCGEHVDQVKAAVPAEQWCDGQHRAAAN
ncbi:hypothetical protein HMPREF3086_17670 [Dietzia sp. HMSC21D01]|nr:hypothetical protein C3V38_02205 [Dietzia sp. oral taxon 368]OFS13022.1 hypothetical protein HMPREF3086_17670 [Dietzia sp. HMSC21D01]PWD95920.1 hypothetical protein DEQ16_08210 [Dietzia maris]